ncbi:MAG: long-chain fatty acid--CoA ligase [Flavobacteriales bacterium]|nr:long-chain fatty acid--CoA ligase [Flavobacteriales bacterium]
MKVLRLFDILEKNLDENSNREYISTKCNGEWKTETTLTFVSKVNTVSRGFLKLGIKPNDKIALITSNNRTEWHILDYAIQQVGAVSVPIYPSISEEDTVYVLNDAEVKLCFVSDEELFHKIESIKPQIPSLVGIYTFDNVKGKPNWSEITDLGKDDGTQEEVEAVKNLIKEDNLVSIIYTSGTTGKPKGVMLSHKNIVSNVLASIERVPDPKSSHVKTLSFLPICHIFERMITYLYQIEGYTIYFAESLDTIGDNLKEVKPHFFTAVPRLIEKVYDKIYTKGTESGGLKRKLFLWSLSLIKNWDIHSPKSLKHRIADMIVFKKWREGVGGNVIAIISGSAALSPQLNTIFHGAGIPILEGYGLTETSPVISVNTLGKNGVRVGSVGKPLKNVEVKIAEDGEILVKGPSITSGYFKKEELNSEIFDENGYFKTGDVGEIRDGFLFITDRKKEMFKTSGGKYIAPQKMEIDFKQSSFIEQIMVVGDGEKMPCALIQPAYEYIQKWIKENNITGDNSSNEAICKNPAVKEAIQKEINRINQKYGSWEQIKRFELTPTAWSIDGGELTPTLKLKRKIILDKYKDYYNKLYNKM